MSRHVFLTCMHHPGIYIQFACLRTIHTRAPQTLRPACGVGRSCGCIRPSTGIRARPWCLVMCRVSWCDGVKGRFPFISKRRARKQPIERFQSLRAYACPSTHNSLKVKGQFTRPVSAVEQGGQLLLLQNRLDLQTSPFVLFVCLLCVQS